MPAVASRNASTPATNAMMVRLETTKTGLWMSRPRNWTVSCPSWWSVTANSYLGGEVYGAVSAEPGEAPG